MFFCLFACLFLFVCLNLSHLPSCIFQIQTKFCVSDNTTEQPKPSILKAHRKWYRPQWKASEESLCTKDETGWTELVKDLALEISVLSWGNSNVSQVFAVHLEPILRIHMKKKCQIWWCTFVGNSGAGEMRQADSWGSLANQHGVFGDFQVCERLCMKNNNKSGRWHLRNNTRGWHLVYTYPTYMDS